MKLKPQNVLVLSANSIFTTFHKNIYTLQYSIIHCSIIVILNYTFTFFYKAIYIKKTEK